MDNFELKQNHLKQNLSPLQGAKMFWIALFMPFIISFGFGLFMGVAGQSDPLAFLSENAWVEWLLNALLQVSFVLAFFIFCRREKVDMFAATKANKKLSFKQAAILAGIALCLIFAFDPITITFAEILKLLGYKSPDTPLILIDSWGTYITAFFTVCIFPAIAEEVVYRGALANSLREYGETTAILLSGVCFALMHQNPDQTMHQFLLGCFLAWLLFKTGSFWAPAIVHFVNNFAVVSMQFYYVQGLKLDLEKELAKDALLTFGEKLSSAIILSLIACGILAGLIYALLTVTPKETQKASDGQKPADAPIKVSVIKMPFADILSDEKITDERTKEVEQLIKTQAEKARTAHKAREKRATYLTIAGGLLFCTIMWLIAFFGVEL